MKVLTITTPSLGDRSYVVHDGRVALVVDPQRDIDRILEVADTEGVRISHVAETHLHNDYVSGGSALAESTGATYVHASAEPLEVEHLGVAEGDRLEVGDMNVEVVHTPGHTRHHLSYVVRAHGTAPAVFTGGSLLYGTVGRTDLISSDEADPMSRLQYRSARRLAALLPDDARIYPTHGFGSFCSAVSSDGESDGLLATEMQVNLALTVDDEDAFVERLVSGLTDYPAYYAHMSERNLAGADPADLSPPEPVDPVELARRIHRGEWVVDLRQRQAFACDHVAGTVGIELADSFSTYLGWLIPWGSPLTLLASSPEEVGEAQRQLVRIGIDRPAGAASGEPSQWADGEHRRSYAVADFPELASTAEVTVLDVRRGDEHRASHVAGAVNVPIHEITSRMDELPVGPLWVHCTSGFRASIAASLLDRAGFEVVLVDDHFDSAGKAGLRLVGRSS